MLWKAFGSGFVGVATMALLSRFVRDEIANGIGTWVGLALLSFGQPLSRAIPGMAFSTLVVVGFTYRRMRPDAVGMAVMVGAFVIAGGLGFWARRRWQTLGP